MNLTPKQLTIMRMVRDSRIQRGYSPTMQEIAEELGVSKVTAFEHVETLIKKGALQRERFKARSLTIPKGVPLPDEEVPLRFPLVGTIAAGLPIEKLEDRDELDVADLFAPRPGKSNPTFALRVEGESMKDEGILEGDYVIIERTEVARNGDRVVALLPDGSTTLKTFHKEKNCIRLQPANPAFEPIRVRECKIQGIVRGVLRKY